MPIIVKHSILFIVVLSMVFIILYGEKYEGGKGKNEGEKRQRK
jgi:hypothetical protein